MKPDPIKKRSRGPETKPSQRQRERLLASQGSSRLPDQATTGKWSQGLPLIGHGNTFVDKRVKAALEGGGSIVGRELSTSYDQNDSYIIEFKKGGVIRASIRRRPRTAKAALVSDPAATAPYTIASVSRLQHLYGSLGQAKAPQPVAQAVNPAPTRKRAPAIDRSKLNLKDVSAEERRERALKMLEQGFVANLRLKQFD